MTISEDGLRIAFAGEGWAEGGGLEGQSSLREG